MTTEQKERWGLDGKIPVVWLVTLAIQSAAFAYWLGGLSQRVEGMERLLQSRESEIARLARIEARLDFLKEQIKGLER